MKIKKFLIILLCCIIVFNNCYVQEARAEAFTGVTVVGGTLAASATLPELLPFIVVGTLLICGVVGVTSQVSAIARDNGTTPSKFIESKILEFQNHFNYTSAQIITGFTSGMSITRDGIVQIAHDNIDFYKSFIQYLITESYMVSDVNELNYSLGNYTYNYTNVTYKANGDWLYNITTDKPVSIFKFINRYGETSYGVVSSGVAQLSYTITYPSGKVINYSDNTILDDFGNYVNRSSTFSYSVVRFLGLELNTIDYPDVIDLSNLGSREGALVGDRSVLEELLNRLGALEGDKDLLLNPSILDAITGGTTGTIDISDYIDLIIGAIDGVVPDIPNVVVPDVPKIPDIPFEDGVVNPENTLIIDKPTTPDDPDTPDIPDDPDTPDIPDNMPYTFDLREFFPFCIPFDLVDLVKKLNAPPEAPKAEWRFYIPHLVDYTLLIDLSGWDSVALVFRKMMDVFFIVALILASRKLIRL